MNKIDLQEKLEILQNFAYENPNNDLTEKIKGNINLKDIKFSNKSSMIDSIKEQSLGQVSFINFLPMSNTIVLNNNNLPITLFLNPYLNDKDIKNNKNPFNIDSAISYLFSPLVINKIVPNLLLPLVNFDIKFSNLPTSLLTFPVFTNMEEKIKKRKLSEMMSVRVRENFNKMTSLHTRISNSSTKNKINLKPIIFQVLYSIAKLDQEYNGFKHNSLDSYSIFLNNTSKNIKYQFNDTDYYVDINNNFVKIGNFSNSYIPKMFKSSNTSNKKYSIMKDKAFDTHYFLNSLIYRDINKKHVDNFDELMEFVNRVLPKKLRGSNKNKYYLTEKSKMKPVGEILSDKYFNDYLIKTKEKINTMVSTDEIKKLEKYIGMHGSEEETTVSSHKASLGTRKLKNKDMKGGYTDYSRAIKNNPNLSNDKKEVFKKKIAEKPRPREPAVLLEQTIYNPVINKPPRPPPVKPFIPINQHNGMPLVNYPYSNILNKVPIQKIYNITIGDPGISGNFIGDFYEDMLPNSPYPLNSLSLEDRIKLRGYVRNILIEKRDGEEMNITGGEKSFRKYVKWGPFNPYSLANNPYEDIGSKFCLYSAFYPMRYDQDKKLFNVAKDATTFNIRTYDLSIGSLYSDRLTEEMKLENFNVFRELRYYKYILSEIINKKVSPNFVNLILYKIDNKTNIKYSKLVEYKMRHLPKALREIAYKPLDLIASIDDQIINAKKFLDHFNVKYPELNIYNTDPTNVFTKNDISDKNEKNETLVISTLNNYIKEIIEDPINRIKAEKLLISAGLSLDDIPIKGEGDKSGKIAIYQRKMNELRKALQLFTLGDKKLELKNLGTESKRSLVLMTEGPTHNILRWASPVYNRNGSQNIMIGTGYHTEEAWMSVYFQIIHAMMVLEKHNIYFRELSLDKNIFIKDVYYTAGNVGYWKYIVDNVSYYVPNLGYIVMFDSSYSDKIDVFNMKNSISKIDFEKIKGKKNFKIMSSKLFDKNFSIKEENELKEKKEEEKTHIKDLLHKDILNILDADKLSNRITHMNGIQPTDRFLNDLRAIHASYKKGTTLNEILLVNFSDYLHSRIGTHLSNSEMNNVSLIPVRNLEKGKMVIYQERFGEYKWAMYVGVDKSEKHLIVDERTTLTNKMERKSVFLASLRSYPENLPVEHVFRKGHKYMEEDLIDTYIY